MAARWVCYGDSMVRSPGPATPGEPPFFTRRSVLLWAAAFVVCALVSGEVQHTQGGLGVIGAVAVAGVAVAGLVAWVGGVVLAARMRSLLLLLGVLIFGPLGSVLVAIVSPATPRVPPPGPRP